MPSTPALRPASACAILAALLATSPETLAAQQRSHHEGNVIAGAVGYAEQYGEPQPTTLERLSSYLAELQRQTVRVSGRLERDRDGRLRLTDGVDAVLLIVVGELSGSDMLPFFGKRIEVTGLAREIPEQVENCALPGMPPVDCLDWNLPMLPARAGRLDLPRNSVTFWEYGDDTPLRKGEGEGSGPGLLGAIVANPERFDGQEVTLIGRYRGANLFGDLPEATRRKRDDWVVAVGEDALWVTKKKPQGKGWRLDLDSRSDGRWFIEVTGEVEAEGGAVYLKADRLQLRRTGPGE